MRTLTKCCNGPLILLRGEFSCAGCGQPLKVREVWRLATVPTLGRRFSEVNEEAKARREAEAVK